MRHLPRVWADFNKGTPQGGIVLHASGTVADLKEQGIELHEGMELAVYDEDMDDSGRPDNLVAEGVVVRRGNREMGARRRLEGSPA